MNTALQTKDEVIKQNITVSNEKTVNNPKELSMEDPLSPAGSGSSTITIIKTSPSIKHHKAEKNVNEDKPNNKPITEPIFIITD